MKLIKKEYKQLKDGFIDTEVYKNKNYFLKIVKGQEFDLETFKNFMSLYSDIIVIPEDIKYDKKNKILEYKTIDVSKYRTLKYTSQQNSYEILMNIISMFQNFLDFSEMQNTKQIFYHVDMKKDNMIFIDKQPKLLDLDSFMWKDREQFNIYSIKCIKKLFGISWGEFFTCNEIPTNYREDWYNTKLLKKYEGT